MTIVGGGTRRLARSTASPPDSAGCSPNRAGIVRRADESPTGSTLALERFYSTFRECPRDSACGLTQTWRSFDRVVQDRPGGRCSAGVAIRALVGRRVAPCLPVSHHRSQRTSADSCDGTTPTDTRGRRAAGQSQWRPPTNTGSQPIEQDLRTRRGDSACPHVFPDGSCSGRSHRMSDAGRRTSGTTCGPSRSFIPGSKRHRKLNARVTAVRSGHEGTFPTCWRNFVAVRNQAPTPAEPAPAVAPRRTNGRSTRCNSWRRSPTPWTGWRSASPNWPPGERTTSSTDGPTSGGSRRQPPEVTYVGGPEGCTVVP